MREYQEKTLKDCKLALSESEMEFVRLAVNTFGLEHEKAVVTYDVLNLPVTYTIDCLKAVIRSFSDNRMWRAMELVNKINRQKMTAKELLELRGFSLVELLVVIMIIGLIAALSVPVIRNMTNGVIQGTVSPKQFSEDVLNARDEARSTRRDTYVVFITNTNTPNTQPFNSYGTFQYGSPGDQPAQHQYRQIGNWQSLPTGCFFFTPSLGSNSWIWNGITNQPLETVTIGTNTWPCVHYLWNGQLNNPAVIGLVSGVSPTQLSASSMSTAFIFVTVDKLTGFPNITQQHVK